MPVRPTSDVSTPGWVPSTGASAYATLDEVAPDDGDYVSSQASGVSPLVLGLDSSVPAGTHRVAVRMRRSAGSQDMIVRLLDGAGAVQGTSSAQTVSTLGTYIFPVTTGGAAVRWELRESAGAQTLVQAGRFDGVPGYYAAVVSVGVVTLTQAARFDNAPAFYAASVNDGSGAPYIWYPALDMNTIPFHTAAGEWGVQRAIVAPLAPQGTLTEVTVSNAADFNTQYMIGSRQITIDTSFTHGGTPIGNTSDVDIIINPGVVVTNLALGTAIDSGAVHTRIRVRGPTVGAYSGGQVHQWSSQARLDDLILDGIALTGADPGSTAFVCNGNHVGGNTAIVNCKVHAGGEAFFAPIREGKSTVFAGNTVLTGSSNPPSANPEAWGFRVERAADNRSTATVVFYKNDIRGNRVSTSQYHRIRMHQEAQGGYSWLKENVFVDHIEARIFTVNSSMVNTGGPWSGNQDGVWFLTNTIYAETLSLTPEGARVIDSTYTKITDNVFYGDVTSSHVTAEESTNSDPITGNTYNTIIADPAWLSPGDPSALDWTP